MKKGPTVPAKQNLTSKRLGSSGKNNLTAMLGEKTKNSPRAGQNLPNDFGSPLKELRGMTSQGAKIMGLHADTDQASGPGDPPAGFVGGHTSLPEWYLYWAFEKVLGPESHGKWSYQNSMLGGRSARGGAVVDFVVNQDPVYIGVRLVTKRFHLEDNTYQKAFDREQMYSLSDWDFIVVDVYESDFINDESGQAAIQVVIDAINREQQIDPFGTGQLL